ncbi:MAG: SycD/LcrH family type III secretion system chaperone [Parachlamydiaceae bacterium]|nr:SycD/LcrH family type III secretion system chaperone [Parachlamydiaceae bacterium]
MELELGKEIKKEEIQPFVDSVAADANPKIKKIITESLEKCLIEGVPLKKAIGMTPEMEEMLYNHGYSQFQGGKYKMALNYFNFLRYWDYTFRYNFAIAACYQYMGNYSDAAANYILCIYLDRANPMPYFHLYDCFVKLDDYLAALKSISYVLVLTENKSDYTLIRERAQYEYNHLKNVPNTNKIEKVR